VRLSYLVSSSEKEITKYVSRYFFDLVEDTFLPDGSFAMEWARFRVLNVLRLLGKTDHFEIILDLGCGIGTFATLLSKSTFVIGVDFSKEAVKVAKLVVDKHGIKSNAELIRCDVQFLPFRNDVLNAIIAADLVEHLNEKQYIKCIRESRRVLKTQGLLVVYTPNPVNLLSPYFYFRRGGPFTPEHIGLKSPLFLYRSLTSHGFETRKLYCVKTRHSLSVILNLVAKIVWVFPFFLGGRTCIKVRKE